MSLSLGLGLGLGRGGASGTIDPASLSWDSYFKAFSASPWNGTASLGGSGSAVMSWPTAGEIPVTGAAVDGVTPCSFDGTDDKLRDPTLVGSDYVSATAYTIAMMVKPKTPAAPAANAYEDESLFCIQNDLLGVGWSTSGVQAWHYDGVSFAGTGWVACSADAWHDVVVTFTAGTLSISVDGGAPASAARGNVSSLASVPTFGRARVAGVYAEYELMEFMSSKTAQTAPNIAGVRAYFRATYPSAGLP